MIATVATRGFLKETVLVGAGVAAISALSFVVSSPNIDSPALTPNTVSGGGGPFGVTNHGSFSNASGSTLAISPVSNIPAGSLIVVEVNEHSTSGGLIGTITDSVGDAYVPANSKSPNNLESDGVVSIWYVLSCKALSTAQAIAFPAAGGEGDLGGDLSQQHRRRL